MKYCVKTLCNLILSIIYISTKGVMKNKDAFHFPPHHLTVDFGFVQLP